MSWGAPSWLQALWLVPLLAGIAWLMLRARRQALDRLGALAAVRTSRRAMGVHTARAVLHVMALCLVMLALAGPRWGWRWQELTREGLDVVVVLDTSLSMGAADVDPSRMERARRELLDLADMMAGDRVGMVIFAGGAYPRMPLTVDYGALRFVARDSTTQTLLARGSDMGAAIDAAVELLDMEHEADKAILLISDGEDHVGQAVDAAARAAEAGAHIYVLGVGTPDGAPVPAPEGGFKKDARGELILSRLDERLLQEVARAGRGAYARSVAGRGDLEALYQGEIRGRLEGAELGVRRERIWNEHYQWPLAGAVVLVLLGTLLRPGRLRLPGIVPALGLAMVASGGLARAGAPDGGDPVARLAARQADAPDDLSLAEELGQALFQSGDYNAAHEVLTGVAERAVDPAQRNRARTNAGLAAYRAGRLTRAVEDWQRVLQDDPEHPAAQANAQAVQQEIMQRMGQEPPEQDGQEQQDGQQQDGQQQDGQQQDGQQQDGQQQDGQQQDGTRPESAEEQEESTTPEGEMGDRGTIEEKGQGDEVDPGQDAAPPEQTSVSGGDTGSPDGEEVPALGRPGDISPEEAQRLLDGVEEGTPRVPRTRHREGDKDW